MKTVRERKEKDQFLTCWIKHVLTPLIKIENRHGIMALEIWRRKMISLLWSLSDLNTELSNSGKPESGVMAL